MYTFEDQIQNIKEKRFPKLDLGWLIKFFTNFEGTNFK